MNIIGIIQHSNVSTLSYQAKTCISDTSASTGPGSLAGTLVLPLNARPITIHFPILLYLKTDPNSQMKHVSGKEPFRIRLGL